MEQGNVAKKLTGQILENWLLTLADGHGGIQTITKTGTSGLVDTYTITFADETTSTFTVTNGRSISGLTTSKSGKVTTITISYNDGTTSSFTVRDGENVSSITEYWAVSTSGSQQPQSGWQTTPPTLTATYKYLWHYSKYTFTDGTNTSTTPAVQGVYGDKGDTGNTGTSITSVTKTGTSGLVDTYTITFSNGTTTTFNVTNGSEIESIEKTSTAGLVDTYTVTMGSGDTHTFTVTNGRSIVSFTQTSGTHAAGTIDVYTMTYNDGDTSQIQVYNGANGTGAVSTVAGIGVSSADGDVPLIIKGYGAPTTATVGQVNQLYFDMTGGIMYICISVTGGTYDWRGMSSAVDSAMSTTSANPLRNSVISNKVGTGSLSSDFTATNLTDAANELMTEVGGKAPTSHASSATTYGKGTSTNYGHVKISDSLTDTTPAATGGIVPSMKAVSDLNGAITSSVTKLNTNLGYIEDGSTSTRHYNAGEYIILNGYLRRVTAEINVGDAFSTSSNITVVKVGTEFVSMKRSTVEKLRVCQYNIGKFNYGNSGGISGTANVERAIANYRTFLANENIDFLTLQEIVQYIGANNTYDAEQWLFSDFFKSTSWYEKETKIKSQYKLTDTAFSYLHTSGDPSAWCIYGKTKVQGSEIMIVSGVLNVTSDTAQKQRALTKLCDTIIGSTENAIIGMDVNVNSESEADSIATFMTNKGYKFGNWGFLGKQKTYNLNSSVYQCIDNIFVKGSMRITNFTVPDVYSGLTSDHYPVIADIDFLVQKD